MFQCEVVRIVNTQSTENIRKHSQFELVQFTLSFYCINISLPYNPSTAHVCRISHGFYLVICHSTSIKSKQKKPLTIRYYQSALHKQPFKLPLLKGSEQEE